MSSSPQPVLYGKAARCGVLCVRPTSFERKGAKVTDSTSRAMETDAGGLGARDTALEPDLTPESPVADVLRQIHALDTQDSVIWSKHLLLLLVFCAGFLSFVFPNLMWHARELNLDSRYLPQFTFGLTALVVLYNAHLLEQRGKLRFAREEMVRQLLRADSTETLSLVDPLTGVYNRRYLDKILRLEMARADRSGTTLSVMMIDLDGFKAINTNLGHVAGDKVLREVAEALNRVFRKSDTLIRYGGDEFLVLMPESDEEQAVHAGTRLAQRMRVWREKDPSPARSLGVSCGIATYRKGGNIQEVIRAADENMYTEKTRHHTAMQDAVKAQSA